MPALSQVINCASPRGSKLLVARHPDRTILFIEVAGALATLDLTTAATAELGRQLTAPITYVPSTRPKGY